MLEAPFQSRGLPTAKRFSTDRYIYVIDANGQSETALVKIAGSNTQPLWTPDGAHLLFVGDQSGKQELLAVAVRGGGPAGEPVPIQTNFSGNLLALLCAGDLFYMRTDDIGFHEVIAERNPAGARVVQTFKGHDSLHTDRR